MSKYLSNRELLKLDVEQLDQKRKEVENEIIEAERDLRFIQRIRTLTYNSAFYLAIPDMMESLGLINKREAYVMRNVIQDQNMWDVADEMGITRERVRQIFMKAIRKSSCLGNIKNAMEENEQLKRQNAVLLKELSTMNEQLNDKVASYIINDNELDRLCSTFIRPLNREEISVRALHATHFHGVLTIGDLAKLAKTDVLKMRPIGKKTLRELSELLEKYGLTFGMDVNAIFARKALADMEQPRDKGIIKR